MNIILSGIKPTGIPTLGNYLGALKNFVKLQNEMTDFNFFFFVADMHAITVHQEPATLRKNIKSLAALYLACGLNKENLTLFVQSEISEHLELGYVMQANAYISELERMTQYKDKMQKQTTGVSSALLTYPVLMAGDILLYNSDYVPVGEDQKQHLELSRNLAERFNSRYSETFKVPEPLIQKVGARIMSLQDPTKKMSKSDPLEKASIFLLDEENVIRKKIASAVTDSDGIIKYDLVNKPGISNLMTIMSCICGLSMEGIEKAYAGVGYGTFKKDLADMLVEHLKPIQERYYTILKSPELDEILTEGASKASYLAQKTLSKMKRKMGIGRK